jgi:hypothetical protein
LNTDPTSSATPTTTSTVSTVGTLSWNQTLLAVGIVALAILLVGVILIWARSTVGGSIVRSWLALSLVTGLVLFCVFSFAIDDATLRSTLLGGLTASVGAAVTFYFQSKTNQDIVDAATGTEDVPDLTGKTQADAQAAMAKTSLKLQVDNAHPAHDVASKVVDQMPVANTSVRKGSTVLVRYQQ